MKKFAFMLATVALFAMSACAFADSQTEITNIVNSSSASNIGVISGTAADGFSARLYYFNKAVTDSLHIAMRVEHGAGATVDDALTGSAPKLGGESGPATVGLTWDTNAKVTSISAGSVNAPNNFYNDVSLDALPEKIEIGGMILVTGSVSGSPTTVSLDLIPTAIAVKVGAIDTFYTSDDSVAKTAVALTTDGYTIVGIGDDTHPAVISWDAEPAGITVAISDDTTLAISAAKNIGAKPGTYKGYVVMGTSTPVTLSEDKGILSIGVAGLDEGDILAAFEVEVKANPAYDVIDAISKDANLANGVNIVDADGKVVPESEIITISADKGDTVLNIVSLDKTTMTPSPITQTDVDKIVIAQGAMHHSPEASVTPTGMRLEGRFVVSVPILASDIEKLRNMVATSSVRTAAVVVDDYEFHLDALGKTLGLVYQTAEEVPGRSSSGACDMGFGLVAAASLAALAIRKRGK